CELEDVAELVAFAELALADRARVGIGERDEPVGDLLASHTLTDLTLDLLGPVGEPLQASCASELALGAATARPSARLSGQPARFAHRAAHQLAALSGPCQHPLACAASPAK